MDEFRYLCQNVFFLYLQVMCGLDVEYYSSQFGQDPLPSLFQIAFFDNTYLLDVKVLKDILTDDDWKKLMEGLLANSSIVKLGFGVQGDLKLFIPVSPVFRDICKQ